MIFRHLYRFLPEESDRLNFHAGVNQVTLSLIKSAPVAVVQSETKFSV